MGTWTLLILLTATWLLWAIGAVHAHKIAKREGRRRPDSSMSVVPIIPFFPLMFFAMAKLVDKVLPSWGTVLIASFHALLAAAFMFIIVWQAFKHRRVRSA